nr:PREDICTED: peroxisomal membrane protein PEX14 [Bemisia tabaci]
MSSSTEAVPDERNKLIDTAVLFLRGPQVQQTPLELRKQFLKKKGLTDNEIAIACDKAGINTFTQLDSTGHNHVSLSVNHQIARPAETTTSWIQLFKDISYTVGFISGIFYALYLFYKKFIRPWLFNVDSPKSIEATVSDIEGLTKDLKSEVHQFQEELEKISDHQSSMKKTLTFQIAELKSEIASLKGLMVNRRQFPSTPALSAPVSIPSWQLGEEGNEEGGNGSNSGASDAEASNNNGSDSSLEMIRSCHDNANENDHN